MLICLCSLHTTFRCIKDTSNTRNTLWSGLKFSMLFEAVKKSHHKMGYNLVSGTTNNMKRKFETLKNVVFAVYIVTNSNES